MHQCLVSNSKYLNTRPMQKYRNIHANRIRSTKSLISWIHPLLLLVSFLLVLIDGELTGGFYIKYLIQGIIHMKPFASIGITGWIIVLLNFIHNACTNKQLNVLGIFLMWLSLFVFLTHKSGYNLATFF